MLTPRYRYVLFDWDGCLASTLEVWMAAHVATYETFGMAPGEEAIARHFNDLRGPIHLGINEDEYETFTERLMATVNAHLPHVDLYPGAGQLVEELSRTGVRMAIITSSTRENLDAALTKSDVRHHFDAIITSDDVANHKPDPEPLVAALQLLNARPEEALMIGDSSNDLGAAANAGTDSMLMYPKEHEVFYDLDHLQTFNPTYVCRSFEEARPILFSSLQTS